MDTTDKTSAAKDGAPPSPEESTDTTPTPTTAVATPVADTTDNSTLNPMMEQSVQMFCELAEQFLDALAEVWPECQRVKQTRLEYRLSCVQAPEAMRVRAKSELITAYHQAMAPFYERCSNKDETVFNEEELHQACQFLANVQFCEKWTDDLHAETKENVWAYVLGMNQYANMYSLYAKVPRQMLNTIENMATGIANNIEQGNMSMTDINVQALGQQVAENINMDDLNEFASSMMQDQGTMTQMYSMLGAMMSQVVPQSGSNS